MFSFLLLITTAFLFLDALVSYKNSTIVTSRNLKALQYEPLQLDDNDKIFFNKLENIFTIKRETDGQNSIYIPFVAGLHYPTKDEVRRVLYHPQKEKSPFEDVDAHDVPAGEKMSSRARHSHDLYEDLFKEVLGGYPKSLVEVGTYMGDGMTGTWAPLAKAGDGFVISIDTWLGGVNMRLAPRFHGSIAMKHGVPTFYHKFMSRVKYDGFADTVFPMTVPSLVAARILSYTNWLIDAIYVDASHEEGETLVELIMYYQLVRPGGLLMGDDYDNFPGVHHDVEMFAQMKGLKVNLLPPKTKDGQNSSGQWYLIKPSE